MSEQWGSGWMVGMQDEGLRVGVVRKCGNSKEGLEYNTTGVK